MELARVTRTNWDETTSLILEQTSGGESSLKIARYDCRNGDHVDAGLEVLSDDEFEDWIWYIGATKYTPGEQTHILYHELLCAWDSREWDRRVTSNSIKNRFEIMDFD